MMGTSMRMGRCSSWFIGGEGRQHDRSSKGNLLKYRQDMLEYGINPNASGLTASSPILLRDITLCHSSPPQAITMKMNHAVPESPSNDPRMIACSGGGGL